MKVSRARLARVAGGRGKVEVKPKGCHTCPLLFAPGPVEGEGPRDAALWVMALGPSQADVVAGAPFRDGFGRTLKFIVKAAGVDGGRVRFAYAAKCVGKKREQAAAAAHCFRTWTRDEVGDATVLACGEEVLDALTFDLQRRPIRQWRGAIIDKGKE